MTERMGAAELTARSLYSLVGVALIGLGAAVLLVGGVGVDPFTAMNTGISDRIGLPLGTTQLIANAVLFIGVLLWGRKNIGLGTIINMVLTGYFIGWFSDLLGPLVPDDPSTLGHAVLFAIGLVIFDFGASAYMTAGVGTAPYDAIAPMIVERTSLPYRQVRAVQDIVCVIAAGLLGGSVGIGTVVTAFFNGPLIEHYSTRVHQSLVRRLVMAVTHGHPVGQDAVASKDGDGSSETSTGPTQKEA